MTTTVRIDFNFPALAAELGKADDVFSVASDAISAIARCVGLGETAGDISRRYFNAEAGVWDSIVAASYEVVDEKGRAVTALHEVV